MLVKEARYVFLIENLANSLALYLLSVCDILLYLYHNNTVLINSSTPSAAYMRRQAII